MSKLALKLDRDSLGSNSLESFEQVGTNIIRKIIRRDGSSVSSEQPLIDGSSSQSLAEAFDASWLSS